jgi:hypothetical protein
MWEIPTLTRLAAMNFLYACGKTIVRAETAWTCASCVPDFHPQPLVAICSYFKRECGRLMCLGFNGVTWPLCQSTAPPIDLQVHLFVFFFTLLWGNGLYSSDVGAYTVGVYCTPRQPAFNRQPVCRILASEIRPFCRPPSYTMWPVYFAHTWCALLGVLHGFFGIVHHVQHRIHTLWHFAIW